MKITFNLLLVLSIANFSLAQVSANFSGLADGDQICINSNSVILTAAEPLGVFSGNGVTDAGSGTGLGEFNPQTAGTGSHQVTYSIGSFFVDVESGLDYAFALADDSTLWSWGNNNGSYQLGYWLSSNYSSQTTPRRIGINSKWLEVASDEGHTLAIKSDGTLWAWGDNYNGQLGNGGTNSAFVQVGTDSNWIAIAVGYRHSMGIKSDGTLWAWGWNQNGQLGIGTNMDSGIPVQVGSDTDWVQVACGVTSSYALKANGTLWSTGNNQYGQLGNGTNISTQTFTQLGSQSNWNSIRSSNNVAMAIKNSGTLWSWGTNGLGILGTGNTSSSNVPIQVGFDAWSNVEISGFCAMGIKVDGTLWSWGADNWGQLGNGLAGGQNVPSQIGSDNDWTRCAVGSDHCLAVKNDGFIWVAGDNFDGILGNGTTGPIQQSLVQSITHDEQVVVIEVIPTSTYTDYHTVCEPFTWIDGNTYYASNSSATFNVPNASSNGCDSIYYLNLNVLSSQTANQAIEACETAEINGNTYTSSQIVIDTLYNQSVNGCDSIVVTDLVINNPTLGTHVVSECSQYTWIDGITYTSSNNSAQFSIPNSLGCDSIITLDLTIENVSDVTVTVNDPTLTANLSGASYQWLSCANSNYSAIPNASAQSFTPFLNGDYAVRIMENGCIDTSACYSIATVHLHDFTPFEYSFAPNPTSGILKITNTELLKSISVYDCFGRLLITEEQATGTIDLSKFANGQYLIHATLQNGETIIERIIKE